MHLVTVFFVRSIRYFGKTLYLTIALAVVNLREDRTANVR